MGYAIFGFYLGAILGSFVKVLADRSINQKSFWGRSYCLKCKQKLHWYDLFPIFSYLILGGRCRYCRDKINPEYLLAEIAMGILIGWLFFQSSSGFHSLIASFGANFKPDMVNLFQATIFLLDLFFKVFFISVLAALFITDLKEMLIPDRISLPAIWVSIIYLAVSGGVKIWYLFYSLNQSVIGKLLLPPHSPYFQRHALIIGQDFIRGALSGLAIAAFFTVLIVITKGKGMGGGDVKLGGLMGIALGFPLSLVALMVSFLTGATVAILLVIWGKKSFGQTIPFGPFLVLGSLVVLFWGNQILNWYLNLRI